MHSLSQLLHLLQFSCKSLSSLKLLHAHLLSNGFLSNSSSHSTTSVSSLLITFYSSFNQPNSALSVLTSLPFPSLFLWNTLIKSQLKSNHPHTAVEFYHLMLQNGYQPDSYTYTFVLKACASAHDSKMGRLVHEDIKRRNFCNDLFISTALVDMYCKLGFVSDAREVFDSMKLIDIATWNAMIGGLSQNHCSIEALKVFKKMQMANQAPNFITVLNLFPSISHLSNLSLCKTIHCFSIKSCLLDFVFNGLIDSYGKCGSLEIAHKLFDEMSSIRNDVTWATIISGFVYNGFYTKSLELFDAMRISNVKLNQVAVLSALTATSETKNLQKACRHNGLVSEGKRVFNSIKNENKLVEHFACMIDLLGHVGKFDEVSKLINDMKKLEIRVDVSIWGAILGACKMHGNMKLGEIALREMEKLKPKNAAHYVVVSNLYAQNERWNEARKMREIMRLNELNKTPGCSWNGFFIIKDIIIKQIKKKKNYSNV
ncbi:hypothetical protein LUZ60_006750 [Juncus effusus]|nr:hypothetical protein LUZ60_006750 [Juncus effusus]